jgi:acyl carrier protein
VTAGESIRRVIAAVLADAGDEAPFGDAESLVVSGRLASIDVVNIVVALEQEFGLTIQADDFDPMRFDSVETIAELLAEVGGR